MQLKDINFKTLLPTRKKCITFAKDGNKVVKPYKTFVNLASITNDQNHHKLYIEFPQEKQQYEIRYQLWEDLGVICVNQGSFDETVSLDELTQKILAYPYLGVTGFYNKLEEAERNNWYINKVDIAVCSLLGNIKLAEHYAQYREEQIAMIEFKREQECAECEQKEQRERKRKAKEIEKIINIAECAIKEKKTLYNIEVAGKSLILHLLKKHSVNVPLRTQGWVNKSLAEIRFRDGEITYSYYKRSHDSTVFYKYLRELEEKILQN